MVELNAAARDGRGLAPKRPNAESQLLNAEIMRTSAELFCEKGFLRTTSQDMADAVGVPKATLFYHIGSKEELLFRIAVEVFEGTREHWRARLKEIDGGTAADRLRAM